MELLRGLVAAVALCVAIPACMASYWLFHWSHDPSWFGWGLVGLVALGVFYFATRE